ncbi:MAG: hypothetical protein QGF12_00210 [SAR202 cluster bacterium]|jgi:hypothetical protein|nr:hypothetical protein [SAR202 cluster bacterium]
MDPSGEAQILKEIEVLYGAPLSPAIKNYLEKRELLQDAQLGLQSIEDVVLELKESFSVPGNKSNLASKDAISAVELNEENRAFAVSGILALIAGEKAAVSEYRNSFLNGKFMSPKRIESWIKKNAKAEGKPTRFLHGLPLENEQRVTLAKDGNVRVEPPFKEVSFAQSSKGYFISYWSEDVEEIKRVPVRVGGVLDKLRLLSDELSLELGWEPQEAVAFVLSGQVPVIEAIRVEVHINSKQPLANRVHLDIDPTMSPNQVAQVYSQARKDFFKTQRRQTLKSQTLALFHAKYVVHTEKPLDRRKQLKEWNKFCMNRSGWESEWQYQESNLDNFQRDSVNAYRQLTSGQYQHSIESL